MKITNIELINTMHILNQYIDKKFPQKIGYAITRNLTTIAKEYQIYETQLKKTIENYTEYFVRDDDGNVAVSNNGMPIVSQEKSAEFNQEVADLLNIEIDIELYSIDEELFDYDDKCGVYDSLSAKEIYELQLILCEFTK